MRDDLLISIVIPVWWDEQSLTRTLQCLSLPERAEVIVASALDDEPRYQTVRECYPQVRWTSTPRGRAVQMNAGATAARGRWLLFCTLIASCRPIGTA
jgi:hypothetical protein